MTRTAPVIASRTSPANIAMPLRPSGIRVNADGCSLLRTSGTGAVTSSSAACGTFRRPVCLVRSTGLRDRRLERNGGAQHAASVTVTCNRGSQRLGLGGRLNIVLKTKLLSEHRVGANRAGVIAELVQRHQEPPQVRFVALRERKRATCPGTRRRCETLLHIALRESPRRLRRAVQQTRSFGAEPILERGGRRRVKPHEHVAAVIAERLFVSAGFALGVKSGYIAPETLRIQADLLGATCGQHGATKDLAEVAQRLTQGASRMLEVRFRPEQRQQSVAAVERACAANREVDEESRTLGLHEQLPELSAIRVAEIDPAEHLEADHDVCPWTCA